MSAPLNTRLLADIEATAVELAQLGGTEIRAALGGMLRVKYKGLEDDPTHLKDPVSEVDGRVEALIRERVSERFPDHDIVGEEFDHRPRIGSDFIWAVDPIDGTTNFINGFPLFASSVGVLYRGQPIVGALWCSTSHALEPGVYHATAPLDTGSSPEEGGVRFNGAPLNHSANPAVRRRLGGEPKSSPRPAVSWDGRKTGSAALECAFVAAGLLDIAWFERPNIWDVAGGMALVRASGRRALQRDESGWSAFDSFAKAEVATEPGQWSAPIAIGSVAALDEFARSW